MASNDNSNLVQELEESFKKCLTALTEEDDLYSRDPEDVNKDIDEKISQVGQIFFTTTYCLHEYFRSSRTWRGSWRLSSCRRGSRSTTTSPRWSWKRTRGSWRRSWWVVVSLQSGGGECNTAYCSGSQGRVDTEALREAGQVEGDAGWCPGGAPAPQHSPGQQVAHHPTLHITLSSYLILSYHLCPVLAPAPPPAQLLVPAARLLTAASCPATPTLAWPPPRCDTQCSV